MEAIDGSTVTAVCWLHQLRRMPCSSFLTQWLVSELNTKSAGHFYETKDKMRTIKRSDFCRIATYVIKCCAFVANVVAGITGRVCVVTIISQWARKRLLKGRSIVNKCWTWNSWKKRTLFTMLCNYWAISKRFRVEIFKCRSIRTRPLVNSGEKVAVIADQPRQMAVAFNGICLQHRWRINKRLNNMKRYCVNIDTAYCC